MKEEIYEYLIHYGLTDDDLEVMKKENEKLYFANLKNIIDNIEFLENKGLEKEEIIDVIRKNSFMITVGTNKKELLDEIYNNIFEKKEIKKLIIKYPDAYIVNPLELKSVIDYLKNKNLNIRDIINENVNVLSFDVAEMSEYIKNRSI